MFKTKKQFLNFVKNGQDIASFEVWKKNTNLYKIWKQRVDENDIRYKLCDGNVEIFVLVVYNFLQKNLDSFLEKVYESGFSDKGFSNLERVKVVNEKCITNSSNNSGYFRNICMEEIVVCGGDNDITLSIKQSIIETLSGHVRKCFFMPSVFRDVYDGKISSSMILSFNKSCKLASILSPNIYRYLLKRMKCHFNKPKSILFSTASWAVPVIAANNLNYENVDIVDVQCNVLNKCHEIFKTQNTDYKLQTFCIPSEIMDTTIDRKYDNIISCPPYYDLEIYGNSDRQSTDLYETYEEWLEMYWRRTVIASKKLLNKNGIFSFIMGHNVRYRFMSRDMSKIVNEEGFQLIDEIKILPKNKNDSIHQSPTEKYEICSYFKFAS